MIKLIIPLFLIFTFSACRPRPDFDPAVYKKDMEEWKANRLQRLKSPEGWLNLAGLYWLREGVNTLGSDSAMDIVFPQGAPAAAGKIILKGDNLFYVPSRGIPVTINDKQAGDSVKLRTDASDKPTIMKAGSFAWFIIQRGDRYGIRLRNYKNVRITELTQIPSFPVSPEWRIPAEYVRFKRDSIFEVPTMIGGTEKYKCPGKLVFTIGSVKTELFPFSEGNEFFIIFGDRTSGRETYPAGRFLYTPKPGRHDHVILDFNKAYNPPCAFSPYATCPLPPPQNRLKVAIMAGEKNVHTE